MLLSLSLDGEDILFEAEGTVEGEIVAEPRGTNGFGYDPIFFYPPFGRTLAELPRAQKSTVSHRGKAFAKLRDFLSSVGQLRTQLISVAKQEFERQRQTPGPRALRMRRTGFDHHTEPALAETGAPQNRFELQHIADGFLVALGAARLGRAHPQINSPGPAAGVTRPAQQGSSPPTYRIGLSISSLPNTPGLIIAVFSAATAPYDDPPKPVFDAPVATGYERAMNGITSRVTNSRVLASERIGAGRVQFVLDR